MTEVEQALVQQIVGTANEAYLKDTYNRTTESINNTVARVLTNLQYNYGQLMPHKLLEPEDNAKKTI